MKMAPSTPTLSIAATISSPVTWGGQFGTLCQGRFGVFASYTWTWESMIVMGRSSYGTRVWLSRQVRVQSAEASRLADASGHEQRRRMTAIANRGKNSHPV